MSISSLPQTVHVGDLPADVIASTSALVERIIDLETDNRTLRELLSVLLEAHHRLIKTQARQRDQYHALLDERRAERRRVA